MRRRRHKILWTRKVRESLCYALLSKSMPYVLCSLLFLLAVCKDMRVQIARMLRKMFMPFRRRGTQTMTVQTVQQASFSSRIRHNANASIRPARGGN
ncbi:hypothetical protein niasHS_008883 [Heterodera schachtii]|uniref:Secreted protein n=1 Tax=Heterodera schachtii TaxID=97005 RepID=A0ABD2J2Q1_HETSC